MIILKVNFGVWFNSLIIETYAGSHMGFFIRDVARKM